MTSPSSCVSSSISRTSASRSSSLSTSKRGLFGTVRWNSGSSFRLGVGASRASARAPSPPSCGRRSPARSGRCPRSTWRSPRTARPPRRASRSRRARRRTAGGCADCSDICRGRASAAEPRGAYSRRASSVAPLSVSSAMCGANSSILIRFSSSFAEAAGVEYGYRRMISSNVLRAMAEVAGLLERQPDLEHARRALCSARRTPS